MHVAVIKAPYKLSADMTVDVIDVLNKNRMIQPHWSV
jgi:hypothetical protein